MNQTAALIHSVFGHGIGALPVECCPRLAPGCEVGCPTAERCRARAQVKPGLWQELATERRLEAEVYVVLGLSSLLLIIIAFTWPFWG